MAYHAGQVKKVNGAPMPTERRGRKPSFLVVDTLLKMQVGDCYDMNRNRRFLDSLARRLRRQYDMERQWTVRETDRHGWSRVWRVL